MGDERIIRIEITCGNAGIGFVAIFRFGPETFVSVQPLCSISARERIADEFDVTYTAGCIGKQFSTFRIGSEIMDRGTAFAAFGPLLQPQRVDTL